jgi:N-methylhydantoinase A/oxoprolinase/acetone carboxylase beta subunit
MASAARLHILEQGEDPSTIAMVAFGGAGPVHAHRIAKALGIGTVIYPVHAGVASAFGLLVAPMTANFVRTYKTALDRIDWAKFNSIFAEMEDLPEQSIDQDAAGALVFARSIDFRYFGQGFEVQVRPPNRAYGADDRASLEQLMREEYRRLFGRVVDGVPLELVNLRLQVHAERAARVPHFKRPVIEADDAKKGVRRAFFEDVGDYTPTPIFDRLKLQPGSILSGPIIIEEIDTTIVVPPGASASIDEHCNVVVLLAS